MATHSVVYNPNTSVSNDNQLVSKTPEASGSISSNYPNAIQQIADETGIKLSNDNLDYLYQYYFQNKLNETNLQREMQANTQQFKNFISAGKEMGFHPLAVLQAISGSTSLNGGSANMSGGSIVSSLNSKRSTGATIGSGIGVFIAMVAAALIKALL